MKKAIGILGGMGPLATADLFRKIVLMTKAGSDGEHIRIYIDNNPQIPDRTACILKGGENPLPQMESALKNLEKCGADCIIMPCNTAHYFLPQLAQKSQVPFINMLKETAKYCKTQLAGKKAAIWATSGTLQTGLYSKALEEQGIQCLTPDLKQQEVLMDAIYKVKGGVELKDAAPFNQLMTEMRALGADYFILGCTELPIVAEQLKLDGVFVDPTAQLARAAIEFCGYEIKQ